LVRPLSLAERTAGPDSGRLRFRKGGRGTRIIVLGI
jgi:hypothetical protein